MTGSSLHRPDGVELGITLSSYDNPMSEVGFATLNGQPGYPGGFISVALPMHKMPRDEDCFDWYNNTHYHKGLAYYTP